ncbi:uncharacterized protein AKAME5_002358600 [Lates japonicus]|uniref:Uncharacterized protein n=1 Tax=Lates japonicus TaxID=270547 RepID=A0AAD3NI15_LATJO|nr:uncharacterized protein AKAME5_002358600 [Lates japonicus]
MLGSGQLRSKEEDRLIQEEFRRITTVSLEQSFMYRLDHYTPKTYCPDEGQGRCHGDQAEAVSGQTESEPNH